MFEWSWLKRKRTLEWLGEEPVTNDDLFAILQPIAAERLTMWPVSKAVGSVKNEGPELANPIAL